MGGVFAGSLVIVILLNYAVMPMWTRHDAMVTVPELRNLPMDEAADVLRSVGLRAELREQPYNPNVAADVVIDQTPLPHASVKPGRRVYYYVNLSPREMVRVPDVTTRSEGVARDDIRAAELTVGEVLIDTLHNPYEGTVTRQTPQGGHAVPRGSLVTLWLSPGLGRELKRVPDVVGLVPSEARRVIVEAGLWADSPDARGDTVRWQEPRVGSQLREGSEVRIHTTDPPQRPEVLEPEPEPEDTAAVETPPPPRADTVSAPVVAPVEPAPVEIPPDLPPIEPLPPLEAPLPRPEDDGGDRPAQIGAQIDGVEKALTP